MKRNVYAKLNQGMDSFLRVAMTLRRKELCVEQISMSQEESGMWLTINHMRKLYDVTDLQVQ